MKKFSIITWVLIALFTGLGIVILLEKSFTEAYIFLLIFAGFYAVIFMLVDIKDDITNIQENILKAIKKEK